MKKRILLMLVLAMFCFASCGAPAAPDKYAHGETTLEFWIAEDVAGVDWSAHDEIYGWMGAREFLGSEYKKTKTKDGSEKKPAHYVSYVITAYPDYADGGSL